VPWRDGRRKQESAELESAGSAERRTRCDFLGPDEWSVKTWNAGLVEVAGTAALANCEVSKITGDTAGEQFGGGTKFVLKPGRWVSGQFGASGAGILFEIAFGLPTARN